MVHVLCTKYLTEKVTSVVETLICGRKNEGRGGCTLSELLTFHMVLAAKKKNRRSSGSEFFWPDKMAEIGKLA
jgi:hypothetical protein